MRMKRKQHYLPKFYLKHFAMPNNQLWCYRRSANRFISNINDICRHGNLYETRSSSSHCPDKFVNPNYIENALSEKETGFADDYEYFLDCCACRDFSNPRFQKSLSTISQLPGFFIERQPYSIENYREMSNELANEFNNRGILSEDDLLLCKKQGYENELSAMIHHYIVQETIINSDKSNLPVHRFSKALQSLSLFVVETPVATQFISCSCPVCITLETNDYTKIRQAFFPLSNRYCAVFTKGESSWGGTSMATRSDVATINRQLLLGAPLWTTAFSRNEFPLAKAQIAYELSGCPTPSLCS